MRYFKINNQTYGYDPTEESQRNLISIAIENGWVEVTESWPPPLTEEELIAFFSLQLQSFLDSGAQAWGYDSIVSAASYAASTNQKFKNESLALIGWRDAVWAWAAAKETAIKSGSESVPQNVESFIAVMPPQPSRPSL